VRREIACYFAARLTAVVIKRAVTQVCSIDWRENSLESLLRSLSQAEFLRILDITRHFQASKTINSLRNSLKQGI
jgi:hypothetical protein